MWNTLFLAVHALAGTVALVAGILAARAGRFFRVYAVSLVVMAVALVPAVLIDWSTTDTAARITYTALLVLAAVMVVRAGLAARERPGPAGGLTRRYLDHLGFTLISLLDAFAVVTAIRGGAPGWLVAVVAVAIGVGGGFALEAAKARLVPATAAEPARVRA